MIIRSARLRAFTLIELLLVVVILAVLAAILVPQIAPQSLAARINATKADISNMETALNIFQVNCGRYPTNDEGLSALAKNPGVEGWMGPYIKLLPRDPWGSHYIYQAPGTYFPESFDLHSLGPDKQEGNDDIANWQG